MRSHKIAGSPFLHFINLGHVPTCDPDFMRPVSITYSQPYLNTIVNSTAEGSEEANPRRRKGTAPAPPRVCARRGKAEPPKEENEITLIFRPRLLAPRRGQPGLAAPTLLGVVGVSGAFNLRVLYCVNASYSVHPYSRYTAPRGPRFMLTTTHIVRISRLTGSIFLVPRHNTVPDPDALHNPCPQHNSCWVTP